MTEGSIPPILYHALDQPSAFTPENLIDDVRRSRQIPAGIVPPVCILEFDGDITDWLVRDGVAKPFAPWACFHTSMFTMDLEDVTCGIIARTDRKSTRLNSSHPSISYAVFCLKKKKKKNNR